LENVEASDLAVLDCCADFEQVIVADRHWTLDLPRDDVPISIAKGAIDYLDSLLDYVVLPENDRSALGNDAAVRVDDTTRAEGNLPLDFNILSADDLFATHIRQVKFYYGS
jgi:hypothetical protein